MAVIFGLLLGIILGIIIFYILLKNGYLKEINLSELFPHMSNKKQEVVSTVTEKIVYISKDKDREEYEEFQTILSDIEFTKNYDSEKIKIKNEYTKKVAELQIIRDKEKKTLENIRISTISDIDKEYLKAQNIRNKTKNDASIEWQKQYTERDIEKNKLRNELTKKIEDLDKLCEKRRIERDKKTQEADTKYSKDYETYYSSKNKTNSISSENKTKVDNTYYTSQKMLESEYLKENNKITNDWKKEILSKLTEDQKQKYKKFL